VPDATADERFAGNPLVTGPEHLRADAGAPVLDRDGLPLGALCVLDRHPRDFDDAALAVLSGLASSVAAVLDRRRPRGRGPRRGLTSGRRRVGRAPPGRTRGRPRCCATGLRRSPRGVS